MFGPVCIHLRGFICQHNPRIAELQLCVNDPVPHGHTKQFLGSECLGIELYRGSGVLKNEVRRDRAISVGNWLGHDKLLLPRTNVQCEEYSPSWHNESSTRLRNQPSSVDGECFSTP